VAAVAEATGAYIGRDWAGLCRVGGAAALIAGLVFRRNIAAEVGLFARRQPPTEIGEWLTLLHTNRMLGLAYLNVFDLVNGVLIALVLLGLFAALHEGNRGAMTVSVGLGFLGVATYLASNTALSLLGLADAYASATNDGQRIALETAGRAMLWTNRFGGPGAHPGAGGITSLVLIAAAALVASIVMLRGPRFRKWIAIVGLLAAATDLTYCVLILAAPALDSATLALAFMPIAGLLWMVWHISVGWRMWILGGPN
jgi:hypothetical protein